MIWIPRILIGVPVAIVAVIAMIVFTVSVSDLFLGTKLFGKYNSDDNHIASIVTSLVTAFLCGVLSGLYFWILW